MAMNKKEQAELSDLQRQLREARAMRFTDEVQPDVDIPNGCGKLSTGFMFNDYLMQPTVETACSSAVHHSFGRNDKTQSQGARRLYSTRLLALRALRHAIEQKCAKLLAGIDQQIEQEQP